MRLRLIPILIANLTVTACATDYASQLSEPGFGRTGMHYTEDNLDPILMMNGVYASKLSNGSFVSRGFGSLCLADGGCSHQAPWWSSGWAP
jgi:hypothetical protein